MRRWLAARRQRRSDAVIDDINRVLRRKHAEERMAKVREDDLFERLRVRLDKHFSGELDEGALRGAGRRIRPVLHGDANTGERDAARAGVGDERIYDRPREVMQSGRDCVDVMPVHVSIDVTVSLKIDEGRQPQEAGS